MPIRIPDGRRDRRVPAPSGRYTGTVATVAEPTAANANQYVIGWRCQRAPGETYDLVQLCQDEAEIADVLADLGLSGQVEASDAVGLQATVEVATFANRSYSRVVDTFPLEPVGT